MMNADEMLVGAFLAPRVELQDGDGIASPIGAAPISSASGSGHAVMVAWLVLFALLVGAHVLTLRFQG